jgi:uncharacterized protein (TIGR02421 family)
MISNSEKQRITNLSKSLHSIICKVSILKHLRWKSEVKREFFANHAKQLPKPTYSVFDGSRMLNELALLKKQLRGSLFDEWIGRHIYVAEVTAKMLMSVGKPEFHDYSVTLYGAPNHTLHDNETTSLALAEKFHKLLSGKYVPSNDAKRFSSQQALEQIHRRTKDMFDKNAPNITLSDTLSSNASASVKRIRLRKAATFTQKDIEQLIQHEASIHVATALNGKSQKFLPTLGCSHAGTTRTQEGLAVFAEFITGTMDINRMRRLSDRMIAIQMSIEGADFLDVYQYFLEQTQGNQDQSFENTQRVFRGGVITGGAPFTKDIVYLDGLVRVHNFLRVAVAANRADCIPYLFSGKLDLDDILVIGKLNEVGLCKKPVYLPEWVSDMGFLFSYMAYSSFLNEIDLGVVAEHYEGVLSQVPKCQ